MKISVKNLNDSLVFYRQLFQKMPDFIGFEEMLFHFDNEPIQLTESKIIDPQEHTLKVNSDEELIGVFLRMLRFMSLWNIEASCVPLTDQFVVSDTDQNTWRIVYDDTFSKPITNSQQCYFLETAHQ